MPSVYLCEFSVWMVSPSRKRTRDELEEHHHPHAHSQQQQGGVMGMGLLGGMGKMAVGVEGDGERR